MAVLIEGISVVVLCRSIVGKMSGGVEGFMNNCSNSTLRSDGELACLTFMTPNDVKVYVEALCEGGLIYRGADGFAVDLVVVDQFQGPLAPCDWLRFGHLNWDNDPDKVIAVCGAYPAKSSNVVVPYGWQYESSLTAKGRFVAGDDVPAGLEFVRSEKGIDVLKDKKGSRFIFP